MVTAVDTSVLIDVLCDDPVFAPKSIHALRKARKEGRMIVCECVLAEIAPALDGTGVEEFITAWDLVFVPSSLDTARLAGEFHSRFCKRGGKAILADFLVGAHACVHANRLLTRDKGYYRDYFKKLQILDPSKTTIR